MGGGWGGRVICGRTGAEAELHAFARWIGLKREWFQDKGTGSLPHYDLTESRRRFAVSRGAKELTTKESVMMWREMRAKKVSVELCDARCD